MNQKKISLKQAKKIKIKQAIKKGYRPEASTHNLGFLLFRLRQEINELEEKIFYCEKVNVNQATFELADVCNIIDFIIKKWNNDIINNEKIQDEEK
jgi:hypothetical protein